MTEHNQKGWLTVRSLKDGAIEQYAIDRSYGRFTAELSFSPLRFELAPFKVSWSTEKDGASSGQSMRYWDIADARKKFRRLQRTHP